MSFDSLSEKKMATNTEMVVSTKVLQIIVNYQGRDDWRGKGAIAV